ncbi:MAG: hypothetical protein FWE57_07625 [Chitinispirillia bacterium]|nr:hypothetical protein [Chitinispirillia bacterium]
MIKINFLNPSISSQGGAPKNKPAVPVKLLTVLALVGAIGYGAYYMMSTDQFSDIFAGLFMSSDDDSEFTRPADISKLKADSGDKPQISTDAKSVVNNDAAGDDKKAAPVDTKTAAVKAEKVLAAAAAPVPVPPPAPEPKAAPAAASLPPPPPPAPAVQQQAAPEPVAATPAPAPRAQQAQTQRPSSLVRTNMIENVVRELGNESRAVKKFDAAYEDMSTVEKINYEVLFARNAFELITRSVPPGVRLRTIEIENFQTVYTSGVSPSREMVQELFSAFRRVKGELLPRPFSHIKDDPSGGFQFVVTTKPRFGLELDDPFQALDHLGFRESLTVNLRKFSNLARSNNFKMRAAPSQISVDRVGSYRRVVYRAEGESTYRDFHKFILALYDEKVPCAFRKITLTARNNDIVHVSAEILFTVKE